MRAHEVFHKINDALRVNDQEKLLDFEMGNICITARVIGSEVLYGETFLEVVDEGGEPSLLRFDRIIGARLHPSKPRLRYLRGGFWSRIGRK